VVDGQNSIHRYECRDIKTACSMITLIYTSRCQQNTLPIPYLHYNVTYFTVDNYWDDKCFTEESLRDDWIKNIQRKYSIVPRNLLFQENPQYGVGGVDHDNDNEGSTAVSDKNLPNSSPANIQGDINI
jgi:hypothetical protein